jgi:hypothetical protein
VAWVELVMDQRAGAVYYLGVDDVTMVVAGEMPAQGLTFTCHYRFESNANALDACRAFPNPSAGFVGVLASNTSDLGRRTTDHDFASRYAPLPLASGGEGEGASLQALCPSRRRTHHGPWRV